MKKLTKLTSLNLVNNDIKDIQPLENLTELKNLNLENNNIRDINILTKVKNLEILFLDNNHISFFNPKILECNLNLNGLYIYSNPIKNIPKEFFGSFNNTLQVVKDHFASLEKKQEVFPLYEAKLLLVGRGFVGKSELAESLTKENYQFEEGRKQTEGIRISEWHPQNCKFGGKSVDFRANLWDFGGQEVYYGTHQFFLSKNAVYLLVWDARQEEDTRTFDYWLRAIGLLSENSPVIIVQNKADQQIKELNQEDIKKNFPFVKGFYQTSCKLPELYDNKRLKEHIISEMMALPHIGEPWNIHRVSIRQTLESDTRNYIREEEYLKICTENGLKENEPKFLSDRLHNLGIILHFQDDIDLKQTVILKPEWATTAFYRIIDNKQIKEINKGSFTVEDLEEVWADAEYSAMKSELLKLMMRFELCFKYENQNRYMVPEISVANPTFEIPDFKDKSDVLEVVFQYDFMPKSIVSRFICRNHRYIKDNMFWQSGVVLEMNNCLALIQSSEITKTISIKVSGKEASKVIYFIRMDIATIHGTVKNPKFDELIPCKSDKCKASDSPHYFKYETLVNFKKEGDIDIRCEKCRKKIVIDILINGIGNNFIRRITREHFYTYPWKNYPRDFSKDEKKITKKEKMKTYKIFIASSKELEEDRKQFRQFISIENDRLVEKGIYLKLVQWEYIFEAVSETRKQDDYNKALKECDLMICLFGTKVGKFTREEFDVAYAYFQKTKSPKIFTYFKEILVKQTEINRKDMESYQDFTDYLRQIEHFQSYYDNMPDLENKFKRNLEEFLDL